MHRLFVALSLPEEIRDRLCRLQNGLAGARWRPVENFHITLAFIGETDRHGFDEAIKTLSEIESAPFALRLSGLGSFGDRKPRAVWARVEPDEGLTHLQAKIETGLRRRGFDLENRKYTPHVTLAYLRGAIKTDVETYCAVNGGFSADAFDVSAFHLYSSQLGSGASHYEIEASYSLSSSR